MDATLKALSELGSVVSEAPLSTMMRSRLINAFVITFPIQPVNTACAVGNISIEAHGNEQGDVSHKLSSFIWIGSLSKTIRYSF